MKTWFALCVALIMAASPAFSWGGGASEIPELGVPKSGSEAGTSSESKDLGIVCSELIDATERAGNDPNLVALFRAFNERLSLLERNEKIPSDRSDLLELFLVDAIKAMGMPEVKTQILTLRLRYDDGGPTIYLIRDSTGAEGRFVQLLEKLGLKVPKTEKKTGRDSPGLQVLVGMVAFIVQAEREGTIDLKRLKSYVALSNLKRKQFPTAIRLVRIPKDLDAELTPLLERLDMKRRGAAQLFIIATIHAICDAFEVPAANPESPT